jgi:hypothetical protein
VCSKNQTDAHNTRKPRKWESSLKAVRPVTIDTTLKNYGWQRRLPGDLRDRRQGVYKGSLWMAGGKSKYYQHLSDWQRATGGSLSEINGITGASVGSGRKLSITLNLADALFDAGYQVHVDAAVEDMRDSPSEVVVPLTTAGAGKATSGRRYIASFAYKM